MSIQPLHNRRFVIPHNHWVETYTGYCSKMSQYLQNFKKIHTMKVSKSRIFPIELFLRYLAGGILEPLYPYKAHSIHKMISNTINDGENHKMSAVLTGKCILLSQKMNIIETSKKVIKILNRPIFKNVS